MTLVYLDESGDTGTNFSDPQQPIFVLGSLLIKQQIWKELEKKYNSIIGEAFNNQIPVNFELHTMDMVSRRGFFVDSTKSFPLQLIDLVLYFVRKYEETKIGKKVSEIHQQIFPALEQLATNLDQHEKGWDILDWVDGRIKK
ncbi:MAG: DUF3800 domain-containing protein [Spirochaetota bacterium]|nr:DUF3800 domain-containing protein [Spirochaetota bacterium]